MSTIMADEPLVGTWFKAAGDFFKRLPGDPRDFGGAVGLAFRAGRAKLGSYDLVRASAPEWVRFDDVSKLGVEEREIEGELIRREGREAW
jgi:hypothetical protein